jgi:hypothetical protein
MAARSVLCGTTVAVLLAACGGSGGDPDPKPPDSTGAFGAPVLLWSRGSCHETWCEAGWYGSPAVADLDGDGAPEIAWGAFAVSALRASDGEALWSAGTAEGRVFGSVAIAPGAFPRVVAGRSGGGLTLYDGGGVPFSFSPFGTTDELRSLAVAALDSTGVPRIVVGRAGAASTALVTTMDLDGNVLGAGWPAPGTSTAGFAWGLYGENVAVAALTAGGPNRILAGTDVSYLLALDASGAPLPATAFGEKVWAQVPAFVDPVLEVQGYGDCTASPRANFATSAPSVADLDGDGTIEIVVVGDAMLCTEEGVSVAHVPFVLSEDRGRWKKGAFDWTTPPVPADGAPLSRNWEVIEDVLPNPVLADLDGDGTREILYPSYDGRLHAFWLDRTEHGDWPYDVPGEGIRFASEPAVVDLDHDGKAEVIFTSWGEKSRMGVGQLHVLDHLGSSLYAVDLPPSFPEGSWNGALGAPTVANIDANTDVEVLVGTARSGVVAYRIPNTPQAKILWGTARGNFQRTGTPPP